MWPFSRNKDKQLKKTKKRKLINIAIGTACTLVFAGAGFGVGYILFNKKANGGDGSPTPTPEPTPATKSISASVNGTCQVNDTSKRATITVTGYNGVDLNNLDEPQYSGLFFGSWAGGDNNRSINVNWVSGGSDEDQINISCDGASTNCQIVVEEPPTTPTSVIVFGATTINAISGFAQQSTYTAKDNTGNNLQTGVDWSIDTPSSGAASGVSIDSSSGVVTITNNATAGTFIVKCRKTDGSLTTGQLSVNLVVAGNAINVVGSQSLSGNYGTSGEEQYTSKDNANNALTGCAWSINDPPSGLASTGISIDNTGKVMWTNSATSGSFIISCSKDGYAVGTLLVDFESVSPKSFLTLLDGTTYTIDTSSIFMSDRTNTGTYNFKDDSGNDEQVNRTQITQIRLCNLPVPLANVAKYGQYLCYGMTNLKIADIQLPISFPTAVGNFFFYSAFYGCAMLQSLPASFVIPSSITTIGTHFCCGMFQGCESLLSLPPSFNIPQNITNSTATNNLFTAMFYNCKKLKSLPPSFNLPSGIAAAGDNFCAQMFQNCDSLSSLPTSFNLPSGVTGDAYSYFCYSMFNGCYSLSSLPSSFNLSPNINNAGTFFCGSMFNGCTSLASLPPSFNLPSNFNAVGTGFCSTMFGGCRGIKSLPSTFTLPLSIASTIANDFCYDMFVTCNSLSSLSTSFNLPVGITAVNSGFCSGMFKYCYSLQSLPSSFVIPSTITTVGSNFCNTMFYSCISLTSNGQTEDLTIPNTSSTPSGFCVDMFTDSGITPPNTPPQPRDNIPIKRS